MPDQPNILFVFSDQQRWDSVNCYGSPLAENLTPHLDAMAAQGTRLQHAFSCQPVCGPCRSCLQSGVYASQTGCVTNSIPLPQNIPTVAKLLDAAG